MNDLVKYHNDMNQISFLGFKEKELNLFFSICYKLKETNTKNITINFSELKKLIGEESNPKRLKKHIDNLNKKLALLNYQFEIESNVFKRFVLFTDFITDYNNNTLTIGTHEDFSYILNNLIEQYTKFDLIDFINLKSIYSKNLFRILKQWDSIKIKKFEIEEFKLLLGVPKSYDTSNLNKRVLNPIIEELPNYFHNLKLEKIKTGRKITHLKFTWSSQKHEIKEVELIEIEISEKVNNAIDKAKKNRFIAKLLNDDNIKILVETFEEDNLIKGLLWAYKEIKKEVTSFNYLIKAIKTGAEKAEKKVVIKDKIEKKHEIIDKEAPLILEKIPVENNNKIRVTQDEYEEFYKTYLKENNIVNNKITRLAFDNITENKYEIILSDEDNKKEKDHDEKDPPMWHDELPEKSKRQILRQKNSNGKKDQRTEFLEEYTKYIKNYFLDLTIEKRKLEDSAISRIRNRKRITEVIEEIHLIKEYLSIFEQWKYMYILKNGAELSYFKTMIEIRGIKTKDIIDLFNILIEQLDRKDLIITKELIEQWVVEVAHGNEYGYNHYDGYSEEEIKSMIKFEDIPEEQLLSKKGKALTGGALESRLQKISKELKKLISYKDKIIG